MPRQPAKGGSAVFSDSNAKTRSQTLHWTMWPAKCPNSQRRGAAQHLTHKKHPNRQQKKRSVIHLEYSTPRQATKGSSTTCSTLRTPNGQRNGAGSQVGQHSILHTKRSSGQRYGAAQHTTHRNAAMEQHAKQRTDHPNRLQNGVALQSVRETPQTSSETGQHNGECLKRRSTQRNGNVKRFNAAGGSRRLRRAKVWRNVEMAAESCGAAGGEAEAACSRGTQRL